MDRTIPVSLLINGRMYVDLEHAEEWLYNHVCDDHLLCNDCKGGREDCRGDYICMSFSNLLDNFKEYFCE